MRLFDLCADLIGRQGHNKVTAALLGCPLIVLGRDIRNGLGNLLYEHAGHDVATATVGKGEGSQHGDTADIEVVPGVSTFPQEVNEGGPENVGVCLGEDIPLHARAHLPRLDNHVEELELVELPAASHIGGTVFL